MGDCVYPNEARYHQEIAEDRRRPSPLVEELKPIAREAIDSAFLQAAEGGKQGAYDGRQVEARGEVAELKDNLNTMIDNLRLTTDRNTEQDWLKTNLARFTNMLQGQRDLATVGRMLLSELAPLVEAQNGVIYLVDTEAASEEPAFLKLLGAFADGGTEGHPERLAFGESLIGQCASDGRRMLIQR